MTDWINDAREREIDKSDEMEALKAEVEGAHEALAGMLDSFGGYMTPEVDAAISVMQAAGKDRWSMVAQMESSADWLPDQDGEPLEVILSPDVYMALVKRAEVAESKGDELRKAIAELSGQDPVTWPDHGNWSLAIAASYALLKSRAEAAEAEATALRERVEKADTVEIVARALCLDDGFQPDAPYDECPANADVPAAERRQWMNYRSPARAALAAVRATLTKGRAMPDPTTPAEEALKPCPFCGACLVFNPAFASGPVDGAFTHPFVMRYICPAEAVKVWPTALAFAAWNRRAPRPDALAVAVEPGKLWSAIRSKFGDYAERYAKATRYEEASAIADAAARDFTDTALTQIKEARDGR